MTYVLEHLWLTRHEAMKQLIYERIDLVKPGRRQELLDDLNERIGIKVSRVEVGRYDLLRDTVQLRVFCFEDEQDHRSFSSWPRTTTIEDQARTSRATRMGAHAPRGLQTHAFVGGGL